MTTSPLARVESRLARAQSHLSEFSQWEDFAMKSGVYGLVRKPNLDGSEHSYFIKAPDTVSERFSTIASDCLHNLRSALDNLIYRLAELNVERRKGGKPISPEDAGKIKFPI